MFRSIPTLKLRVILIALLSLNQLPISAGIQSPVVPGYETFYRSAKPSSNAGRLLLSELSCSACHANISKKTHAISPKLGPNLQRASKRFSHDWLKRFVSDPHETKPGTTMPALLNHLPHDQKAEAVEALVQYVLSVKQPLTKSKSPAANDSNDPQASSFQRGFDLYHATGCVACHHPIDKSNDSESSDRSKSASTHTRRSVPLGDVASKYDHDSLTQFLVDPLEFRPTGRMPNLKLTLLEAADVAHFLLNGRQKQPSTDIQVNPQLAAKGKELFRTIGCANCHSLPESNTTRNEAELKLNAAGLKITRLTAGCLSEQAAKIDYSLDRHQIESIRMVLSSQREAESSDAESVDRSMLVFNCYACHTRKLPTGKIRGGIAEPIRPYFQTIEKVDFGDEGRIPPSLTNVGRKLTKSAFQSIFAGKSDVRPHMSIRMPKFGKNNIAHMTDAFFHTDGGSNSTEMTTDLQKHKKATIENGRQLLDYGCTQCHSVNGQKLTGVVGVDLTDLEKRLQPKWFREFLLNPERIKPGTRMPSMFVGKRSLVTDILDGDAELQTLALWNYLKNTKDRRLPGKIANDSKSSFELIPKDEPILLRTFMKKAGTHAIAVGFPQKIHFAFDADRVRLAIVWKGRFLDAHGTWFDRFTPPAVPLSDDRMSFPSSPSLATLADAKSKWPKKEIEGDYRWRGFRLDKQGIPSFLYEFKGTSVIDRIDPLADGQGIVRSLTLTLPEAKNNSQATDHPIWYQIATSAQKTRGLKWKLVSAEQKPVEHAGEVRILLGNSRKASTIKVEYRW